MGTPKRLVIALGLIAGILVASLTGTAIFYLTRDNPQRIDNIREHFKYGSFGSEERQGYPEALWRVLPTVFPDLLPERPGEGYERFGLITEDGADRPIGFSLREKPIALLGLNCAVCHTGTVRFAPDAEPVIYLGMPAHQFDLQAYARFQFAVAQDDRFNAGTLIDAMKANGEEFSRSGELFWRLFVIPEVKRQAEATAADFGWWDARPDQGPGRVDTFNPYKVFWNEKFPGTFDMSTDETIGTADLPSLWLQGPREGMDLHWDGNNSSVRERNRSAAIGAGASESSLEEEQLIRIADWIDDLPPPRMPFEFVDWSRVPAGKEVYAAHCASCHAFDGAEVGQVVPIDVIGTDPYRLDSFSAELVAFQNMLGEGRPWALSQFKKTNGYANSPLDGTWLRAPYLHNGSVPTLWDLLEAPESRPATFYRGYDVYDFDNVGFVTAGPDAEREGFFFDTSLPGNGNGGHRYGVTLSRQDKDDLIEYMKTL